MKKVAFVLYREWAYNIYEEIVAFQQVRPGFEVALLITTPEQECKPKEGSGMPSVYTVDGKDNEKINLLLKEHEVEVVFYYGWSWIVKEPILSEYICLCLHPSPLPKYRGGTPIQHQIIAGEKMSAVSVFEMGEGLDDGAIYKQLPMSLEGTLDDVLFRMIDLGVVATKQFICDLDNDEVVFVPQKDLELHPPLKRRKPEDGEIVLKDVEAMEFTHLHNVVRSLADPYPNAYILFPGKKVLLQKVQKYKNTSLGFSVLKNTEEFFVEEDRPFYITVSDGYALVIKYKIESLAIS